MHKTGQIKTAIALAIATLAGGTASAADKIELVRQGTAHQALFALDFNGASGIAVGAFGEVQTSEDGGKTWKTSKVDTDLSLLDVHVNAARTLAVGQEGLVFLKNAGGEWEKVKSGLQSRLFGVASNADGLGAAVGEFGTLALTEDGGRSWHKLTLDWMQIGTEGGAEPHLYAVDIASDGGILVVGEFGLVLRSNDRGRTWSVQSRGTPSLFAIELRDDGKGYAVGQDGYALKTLDHGLTWTCIDVGSKAILNGVHASGDGRITITAMREMIVSSDDGSSWRAFDNPEVTTMWYVGVDSSGGEPLAVGQQGRIIRVGSAG